MASLLHIASPDAKNERPRPARSLFNRASNSKTPWWIRFAYSVRKAIVENYPQLTLCLLATTLLVITICFSQFTFFINTSESGTSKAIHLPFSSGIAVLRSLQGVTSTATTFAVAQAFAILQWTVARRQYSRLHTFLALSPSTGFLGLFRLGLGKESKPVDKVWSYTRLLFLLIIWLAGIVLFINTSFVTAYEPTLSFDVTAGTGKFNGSFVAPTVASVNGSISYWILATASTLLSNPQFAAMARPILCAASTAGCNSYLLPGGLQSISPNPPPLNNDPVVVVHSSPASQVEFRLGIDGRDRFLSTDCVVYGDDKYLVGLELCLAPSVVLDGSVIAGVFVCSNGTVDGQCRGSGPRLNVSTTMTVFSRLATATCARSNNSILSVSDLGVPTLLPLNDTDALQLALGWLLNYTAAELPPVSSIAFLFWNRNEGLSEHDWSVIAYQTLTNILAFTSWFFSDNQYGNPDIANSTSNSGPDTLPKEFHTMASMSKPVSKFIMDRRMFAVYMVLQVIPLIFCWAVLLWHIAGRFPRVEASSFPVLDFMFKAECQGSPDFDKVHLEAASDNDFLHQLKEVKVVSRMTRGHS